MVHRWQHPSGGNDLFNLRRSDNCLDNIEKIQITQSLSIFALFCPTLISKLIDFGEGQREGKAERLERERERERERQSMATCNMASAASGFVLTPNVSSSTSSSARSNMVCFPVKNNNNSYNNSRLVVVRAAEEGAAPPATTAAPAAGEAPKPKPPPIGPKRGAKVSNPPSIWCHSCQSN